MSTEKKEKRKEQTINLTKTTIENLPFSPDKPMNVWDARLTGFGVRISKTSKTYFVYSRVKGRLNSEGNNLDIRESIGHFGIMRFDDARNRAKEILEDAAIGITPDDRKFERETSQKNRERLGISLSKALDEYLSWNHQIKESTKGFYRLHINTYLADWLNRPIKEITTKEVEDRHKLLSQKIVHAPAPPYKRKPKKLENQPDSPKKPRERTNGPGVANGTMRALRAVINHILNIYPEINTKNPVRLTKQWNNLKDRENFILPDKLPAWFRAVNESKHTSVRDVLLLLLFTGLRSKSEAFTLKWDDIDWSSRIMTFVDTKNSTTLKLPMSTYVYDLLKQRKDAIPAEDVSDENEGDKKSAKPNYVFPAQSKSGHIVDIRDELQKINSIAGIKITPHDLRRTFTTYADDSLDISFLTIKALVNHETNKSKKDVTAKYIKVEMYKRVRAIQAICDYILQTAQATIGDENEQ